MGRVIPIIVFSTRRIKNLKKDDEQEPENGRGGRKSDSNPVPILSGRGGGEGVALAFPPPTEGEQKKEGVGRKENASPPCDAGL